MTDRASVCTDRDRYLSEVMESLIETLDTGESMKRLAELAVPRLADWALVATFGEGGGFEERAWAHRDPAARADLDVYLRGRRLGTGADATMAQTLRTRGPLQVTDHDWARLEASLPNEKVRAAYRRLATRTYTVLPLRARGETFGALALMNCGDRPPHTEAEIATADEVARRGSLALDNARLYSGQHKVAETLQRSMLTPPPPPDGLEFAVSYRPATVYQQVGGDWYDVFGQSDGSTVLVIGDVVGHTVEAAAAMGQIRSIVRGIAVDHPGGPALTLARVDRALAQLDVGTLATAVFARLDPPAPETCGQWTLRWSSAGHLPPAVLHPDGSVRLLATRPERLLGTGLPCSRTTHETTLNAGDTVLLYTDGLIEHGGRTIDAGTARLTTALGELPGVPLEDFCAQLLSRIAPGRTDDDIALLAVRCRMEVPPRPGVARPRRPSRLRQWETPTGLRHGDHVCWTFADDEEFSAAAVSFLEEGRRRGEQLLLTGECEAFLMEALEGLPQRDVLLASGQLELRSTAELYGGDQGLDPAAQVRAFRAELDAALERGCTGLRVAADITPLARGGVESRQRLHVYERLADSLIGSSPLTGMCLYDSALDEQVLGPLTVLHPVQHNGYREPLAHLSGRGSQLSLHGEIADHVAEDVFTALFDLACAVPGEIELDLSELAFLDLAGGRGLARTVRLLGDVGVQLRLVEPQPLVARVLDLVGLGIDAVTD